MNDTKIRHLVTPESHEQARQALYDIMTTGKTDIICPYCGTHPKVTNTERCERTYTMCECGYIFDMEINL